MAGTRARSSRWWEPLGAASAPEWRRCAATCAKRITVPSLIIERLLVKDITSSRRACKRVTVGNLAACHRPKRRPRPAWEGAWPPGVRTPQAARAHQRGQAAITPVAQAARAGHRPAAPGARAGHQPTQETTAGYLTAPETTAGHLTKPATMAGHLTKPATTAGHLTEPGETAGPPPPTRRGVAPGGRARRSPHARMGRAPGETAGQSLPAAAGSRRQVPRLAAARWRHLPAPRHPPAPRHRCLRQRHWRQHPPRRPPGPVAGRPARPGHGQPPGSTAAAGAST